MDEIRLSCLIAFTISRPALSIRKQRNLFMKNDVDQASVFRIIDQYINRFFAFIFLNKCSKYSIKNNERVLIVLVNVLGIAGVMHAMMRRSIHGVFQKTKFGDNGGMLHKCKQKTNGLNRQNINRIKAE